MIVDKQELRRLAEEHLRTIGTPMALPARVAYDKAAKAAAILSLLDELEQYRKDAERYLWLRDGAPATVGTVPMVSMADEAGGRVSEWIWGAKLDDKIDAAMAKEQSQ